MKKRLQSTIHDFLTIIINRNLTRKATPVTLPLKGLGTTRLNEQLKQFMSPSGASIGGQNEGPGTLDEGDYHPTRRLRGLLGSINKEKESFDRRLNQTENFRFSLQVLKDNSVTPGRPDLGINFLTGGDVGTEKAKKKIKKSGDISQDGAGVEPKTLLEKKLLTQYGNTDTLDGWDHNESPTGFDHDNSPDSYTEILMKRTRG